MKKNRGIMLMEILVVLSIMTIIVSISYYFFAGTSKTVLEKDAAGLTAFLREARLLSIASKNASSFGIHLENEKAVLFQGTTYIAGGPEEKILEFSRNVYISDYSLNLESPDIVFGRLSGHTQNFGTVTLSLKDDSASTTVTILRTGVVQ